MPYNTVYSREETGTTSPGERFSIGRLNSGLLTELSTDSSEIAVAFGSAANVVSSIGAIKAGFAGLPPTRRTCLDSGGGSGLIDPRTVTHAIPISPQVITRHVGGGGRGTCQSERSVSVTPNYCTILSLEQTSTALSFRTRPNAPRVSRLKYGQLDIKARWRIANNITARR